MRSGRRLAVGALAWALALGPATSACSGGYPLPPTRCDDWCDVTKGMTCEDFYNPAGCVSQCEQSQYDAKECREQLDAVLACFRSTPSAAKHLCVWDGTPNPCHLEFEALGNCVSYLFTPADFFNELPNR